MENGYESSLRGALSKTRKKSTMKLKKPIGVSSIDEKRYLTHCMNIARILADKNGWGTVDARLKLYVDITGVELADD